MTRAPSVLRRWHRATRSAPALLVAALFAGAVSAGDLLAQDQANPLANAESLGWAVGSVDAPVTVVEFTDVSCPYCASFHGGTRASLRTEFVEGGSVRWVTLSYVSGLYPNSAPLSVAAECAGSQGQYEGFLDRAYSDRDSWLRADDRGVSEAIARLATQAELDLDAFQACLTDPAVVERIQEVGRIARIVGVRGTPTWFVDGFLVMGDLPLAYARQFIVTKLPG